MQRGIILEGITREDLLTEISKIVSEALEARLKPEPEIKLFTKKETAAKLRISSAFLDRLTAKGTIQACRIGKRVLFPSDQVDLLFKSIDQIKYKRN